MPRCGEAQVVTHRHFTEGAASNSGTTEGSRQTRQIGISAIKWRPIRGAAEESVVIPGDSVSHPLRPN